MYGVARQETAVVRCQTDAIPPVKLDAFRLSEAIFNSCANDRPVRIGGRLTRRRRQK